MHQRYSGRNAGDQTALGLDRHGRQALFGGPAGAGVEHMPVDAVTNADAALIHAATGKPALSQRDTGHRLRAAQGIANTDLPRRAPVIRPDDGQVSPQVDQPMPGTSRTRGGCRRIRGVLLHKTAKIQLHAGRQVQGVPIPTHAAPANIAQTGAYGIRRGQAPAAKIPDPTQHAGRDVKAALALLVGRLGKVQQARGFRIGLPPLGGAG